MTTTRIENRRTVTAFLAPLKPRTIDTLRDALAALEAAGVPTDIPISISSMTNEVSATWEPS